MYLQITTKCNMACEHCCSSCSPKTGKHMTKEIFQKALEFCAERGETPFIGGGEPTVHPQFWEFLGLLLGKANWFELDMLSLITNGKNKKDALALATLARKGILSVELSQDEWHEEIDPQVVDAFTVKGEKRDNDLRGIRTVFFVSRTGRGKNIGHAKNQCVCEEMVIDPDGKIWACGCKKVSFGTIEKPKIPEDYESGHCYGIEAKPKLKKENFANITIKEKEITNESLCADACV
jgi:hypothetical protein